MKFKFPSTQYFINFGIGLAVAAFVLRFVPEKYKAYFRV